jgi:hypothetical protein
MRRVTALRARGYGSTGTLGAIQNASKARAATVEAC